MRPPTLVLAVAACIVLPIDLAAQQVPSRAPAERPPSTVTPAPAGPRLQPPSDSTWPALPARPAPRVQGAREAGSGSSWSRREKLFMTAGAIVGAGAAFAACRAHRPEDVTKEANTLVAMGCGMFGGLLGSGIGLLVMPDEDER